MNYKEIWQTVLGELEVSLSRVNFTTWFKDTFIYSCNDNTITISVPNSFTQEWLQKKYDKQIKKIIGKIIPTIKTIEYKIISKTTPIKEITSIRKQKQEKIDKPFSYIELEPKYTFDSFIIGNSNRLAYATACAIAKTPGKKYNPFFIYGGVGLGKTHLMQAIGNEVLILNPKKKIIYTSCEEFTNEFVSSIQNKTTNKFKDKYRNIDILLVDDIQFLSGKNGTQEEFFHTFNSLHRANRQVILTADRKPQDIPEMTSRLSSRFSWGMVADIQPPDIETRKAILAKKSEERKLNLSIDIIDYISENIKSNIRELEGALNKIKTHLEIYQQAPNLDLITKILAENIDNSRFKNLNTPKIIKVVCDFFGVEKKDILSKRRNKELVYPRQIIMYLLRGELNYSYPKIGKELGGKDHTTIIHGVGKIEKLVKRDSRLQNEISLIKEKLYI